MHMATGAPRPERPPTNPFADIFSGASLDIVKIIAAVLMVVDHVNALFLGHEANILWLVGRLAFPLFVFALACNLHRGTKMPEYIAMLLALGAFSQPFYATAMGNEDANILFALAAGAAILWAIRSKSPWLQHAVFFAGTIAIFTSSI